MRSARRHRHLAGRVCLGDWVELSRNLRFVRRPIGPSDAQQLRAFVELDEALTHLRARARMERFCRPAASIRMAISWTGLGGREITTMANGADSVQPSER